MGELTLTRFLSFVHPKDRATVEAAYRSCAGVDLRFAAPSGPTVSWKDSGLPIYIPAVQCILTEEEEE